MSEAIDLMAGYLSTVAFTPSGKHPVEMREHAEIAFRIGLESLVGCDCDNGWRLCEHSGLVADDNCDHAPEPCIRCVLVEVGGIRMRTRIGWNGYIATPGIVGLPAVEVADA